MFGYLFRGLSVLVDATFGQFSKCIIRLLLFRQGIVEKLDRLT